MNLLVLFAFLVVTVFGRRSGGWEDIQDLQESSLLTVAAKVSEKYDTSSEVGYTTQVLKVREGKKQVVSGMNYEMVVELGETDCTKPKRDGCSLRSGGASHLVTARVWVQSWRNFYEVTLLD